MFEKIKALLGLFVSNQSETKDENIISLSVSDFERLESLSKEKIESLSIEEVAFFASLREEIELLRDLINIVESPEEIDFIEEYLDKRGYDYSLPQNKRFIC
ncbi:hypothetical protein [Streptococcus sp. zg-JUN1979]|uniref:hypothetical protein n=1 Tax=Streptococcus sp. zg-JUN1979 TaxID=3391450 RepID=UPI0039A62C93